MTEFNFQRCFKDHIAKLSHFQSEDNPHHELDRLVWGNKDGSCIDRIVYLIDNHRLFISGDWGSATYIWSSEISFGWLSGLNIDYFASKCEASENGRGHETWDENKARTSFIFHFIDDAKVDQIEFTKDDLLFLSEKFTCDEFEIEDAVTSEQAWNGFVSDYYSHFDCDDYGIGFTPSLRCRGHLEGIKQAIAQLEANHVV